MLKTLANSDFCLSLIGEQTVRAAHTQPSMFVTKSPTPMLSDQSRSKKLSEDQQVKFKCLSFRFVWIYLVKRGRKILMLHSQLLRLWLQITLITKQEGSAQSCAVLVSLLNNWSKRMQILRL